MASEKIINTILLVISEIYRIADSHSTQLYKKSTLWQPIRGMQKKLNKFNPNTITTALRRLEQNGVLLFCYKDNLKYYRITKQGMKKIENLRRERGIEEMEIVRPEKWNGRWKIIIFDIPDSKKNIRDILRETLKRLGFYSIQESVFIHPYASIKQLEEIRDYYNVARYVKIIGTDFFEDNGKIKKFFGL